MEKLNELSKKTLGSYIKKASIDAGNNQYRGGEKMGKGKSKEAVKHFVKNITRNMSIGKAVDKLTKEGYVSLLDAVIEKKPLDFQTVFESIMKKKASLYVEAFKKDIHETIFDKVKEATSKKA